MAKHQNYNRYVNYNRAFVRFPDGCSYETDIRDWWEENGRIIIIRKLDGRTYSFDPDKIVLIEGPDTSHKMYW